MIHNHDPMLLELFISFCQTIQLDPGNEITSKAKVEKFRESEPTYIAPENPVTYQSIMENPVPTPTLQIGVNRPESDVLRGMRFHLIGYFPGTSQDELMSLIKKLGGTCVSRSSAVTLLKNHSKTPHCYVILNDEQFLRFATDMGEKVPFEKFAIAKISNLSQVEIGHS